MKEFTEEEKSLINSLNEPKDNLDEKMVESIIDKLLNNKDYEELIHFLNTLYDFAKIPGNIVDKLIDDNNKEGISIFLDNEDDLFFLSNDEKNKLKEFLNVFELNVKLEESYDYYYKFLFNQGFRHFKEINIDDDITEHLFIRYNKLTKIKLREVKNIGTVVSYVDYKNYDLTEDEQILKAIECINEYGFNIDSDVNNPAIIKDL